MEQGPAEREPLRHPARVRGDTISPCVPQPEALEQHADPLSPLRHPVQPAVEVQVLDGGELVIDERLVREIAEAGTVDVDAQRPAGGGRKPRDDPHEGRLAGAVAAGDDQEAAAWHHERDAAQHPLAAVALLEAFRRDQPRLRFRSHPTLSAR